MAGAGLLGWIAGHMIVTDAAVIAGSGPEMSAQLDVPASIVGVMVVLGIGWWIKRRRGISLADDAASSVAKSEQRH